MRRFVHVPGFGLAVDERKDSLEGVVPRLVEGVGPHDQGDGLPPPDRVAAGAEISQVADHCIDVFGCSVVRDRHADLPLRRQARRGVARLASVGRIVGITICRHDNGPNLSRIVCPSVCDPTVTRTLPPGAGPRIAPILGPGRRPPTPAGPARFDDAAGSDAAMPTS